MANSAQYRMLPVTSIVNEFSGGGVKSTLPIFVVAPAAAGYGICKVALSGALTADTYKELLSISGAGIIDICAAVALDGTTRTIGLKVVIDGVTVFYAVSAAITTAGQGIVAIGITQGYDANFLYTVPQPCVFSASLSISVKSSLSETDLVQLGYNYRLT